MSTFTLLIYEEVPETTSLYLIPNEVADEYREHFRAAHGRFINNDDENEGMRFLNLAVCEDPEGLFFQYLVDAADNKPIEGEEITHVYLSGFVL